MKDYLTAPTMARTIQVLFLAATVAAVFALSKISLQIKTNTATATMQITRNIDILDFELKTDDNNWYKECSSELTYADNIYCIRSVKFINGALERSDDPQQKYAQLLYQNQDGNAPIKYINIFTKIQETEKERDAVGTVGLHAERTETSLNPEGNTIVYNLSWIPNLAQGTFYERQKEESLLYVKADATNVSATEYQTLLNMFKTYTKGFKAIPKTRRFLTFLRTGTQ